MEPDRGYKCWCRGSRASVNLSRRYLSTGFDDGNAADPLLLDLVTADDEDVDRGSTRRGKN